LAQRSLSNQHFDSIAVGVLDFKQHSFESFEFTPRQNTAIFDLASLTKPLTLGVAYLAHPELFGQEEILLLNHRGGLPAWSRLSAKSWREQIISYEIKPAKTNYSDLSALRLMLILEQKSGSAIKQLVSDYWHPEITFWTDLPPDKFHPATGMRNDQVIQGIVNDDNALTINQFTTHAGLFSNIEAICHTMLKIDRKLKLLATISNEMALSSDRFIGGWDRVEDLDRSLAGSGASNATFGHLGFTGTSIWIDPHKRRGHIILTNATQKFAHDRTALNQLRREIGSAIFS
jgi:CubicO group peptidase (beta-lactamase class C family)